MCKRYPVSITQTQVYLVDLLPHIVFVVFAQPAPAVDHVFGNDGGLPAVEQVGTVHVTSTRLIMVKTPPAAQVPCPTGAADRQVFHHRPVVIVDTAYSVVSNIPKPDILKPDKAVTGIDVTIHRYRM